ncbi:MAG: AAA family ATPase [Acidobacteria bacterium]|nr:AAA family ATPase [Acidobacteriota bacterium]
MDEHTDVSGVRDRAIALYTFLKEFTELRASTIRSLDQYEQVLWFSDIPREAECNCAAWHRGQDSESGEVWLEIRHPRLIAAPTPSEELAPWLVQTQVADSSIEMPELRPEIATRVEDETGEQGVEHKLLTDHPEIKPLWERYVETRWWPWAEADRQAQAVQRVYTQLFSIYQKQQRLGEQYEVVVGLGLLTWRTPDGQEIRRHLIAASTSVAFDAARGIMSVGPAGEGAKTHLEQDMLDPTTRPDALELRALEGQIGEVGEHVWDPTSMDSILAAWVHSASPRGVYSDVLRPPESAFTDPQVHLAPALILRKRTERSYVKAFEEIIGQLNDGAPIPPGVGQFVTVTDDRVGNQLQREVSGGGGSTGDLYFPLESNEAQQQIVERLASHTGVLVQGPPGTGKSHSIVNLICHLLASGQRVLVTSHAARALKVLQRYIRERAAEISPLAVVLLGDDREALQAMEDSVHGITYRHNQWDAEASLRRTRQLQSQLDEARKEEATVLAELRAIRERETYSHPVRFGAYGGTLQALATRLRQEEESFGWIEDRPAEDREPPLSSEQLGDLLFLLRDVQIDEWHSRGVHTFDASALPSPDLISALVDDESLAKTAYYQVSGARDRREYSPIAAAPNISRNRLGDGVAELLAVIDRIGRHLHTWTEKAVLQILGDQDRAWRDLFEVTKAHLSRIGTRAHWADETAVSGLGERDHHEVRADAEAMLAHLEKGGGWGIWPFRGRAAKARQYLRREIKVAGRSCETPETLRDLTAWLDVEERLRFMRERWAPFHTIASRSYAAQVGDLEDLCEPLEAALSLHERVRQLRSLVQAIPGLAEPTWHDLNELRGLRECVAAVCLEFHLQDAGQTLVEERDRIASQAQGADTDPAGMDLLRAIEARDVDSYRESFSRILQNQERANALKRRNALLSLLRDSAPLLAEELASTARDDAWDHRAVQFASAWNWARTTAWVERLCDQEIEQQLRLQLDSARDRIRNLLKELAAEMAWSHCFARMTEHERQHLVAWSKAVRSIGKGTGKYAPMHRRNAREHLNECRSAIPAWVMPLYRVAETIKPGNDLFDVVIIDEASQSGPEALLLAYLSKKLVVVGDDKQISPTYAGVNHEDVNQLRARHIMDLPHADAYGVQQSFFDLAEIRYPGRIRLREHFRCMPEIIQFSNNLCYQSEPLIPLRQFGGRRLSPVISVRHVPEGYLKGHAQSVINPPEAQAIVDSILRIHADAAYDGKTFGVISLLGDSQAREIERLLLDKLGPPEMERRQLVCGDAYAFQGDERDVMFLSLVSAPSEDRRIGTLTDDTARRRFNVAASRARDQLFLFHTATLNDLSPQCFRYALLAYCQNPAIGRSVVSGLSVADFQRVAATADRMRIRAPEPFESWFEVDVFLQLTARGYRVLPQYEVAGYRIDLVVEGMNRRVAVECDGDRWHGRERYELDMARQRMLERCGWKFWRVRGSAFSLDPEAALDDLWDTLAREEVYPEGHEHSIKPESRGFRSESPGSSSGVPGQAGPGTLLSDNEHHWDSVSELENSAAVADLSKADNSDKHSDPLSADGMRDLADAPYEAWCSGESLPNPVGAHLSDLVPGLVSIVSIEGPITAHHLYRIFVKGAGRQRVGRQSRSALNKAVSRAVREGLIDKRNDAGQPGVECLILRKAGTPSVTVRPRGNREFTEIPPSEVATVILRLREWNPLLLDRALYRAVLDFYETKRMTANIEVRLRWIFERRHELAGVEGANRGAPE